MVDSYLNLIMFGPGLSMLFDHLKMITPPAILGV